MTVGQILNQAWKMLGEPTDLNPDDITGTGRIFLLEGLNAAIKAVAFFKDGQTREHYRFNQFRKEVYIKYQATSGTGQLGGSTTVLVLSSLPAGETDIAGSVVTVAGETTVIASNVGVTCTLIEPLSATTSGASYSVYPRWIRIPGGTEFIEVLKVEDMTNTVELTRSGQEIDHLSEIETVSNPSSYYRIGNKVYLNTVPSDSIYFRLWLFRAPATVLINSTTPELPASMHFGIILWLVYWGYQWMNEPTDAYAAQNRFTNYMRTTRNEMDVRNEMTDHYDLSIRVL